MRGTPTPRDRFFDLPAGTSGTFEERLAEQFATLTRKSVHVRFGRDLWFKPAEPDWDENTPNRQAWDHD